MTFDLDLPSTSAAPASARSALEQIAGRVGFASAVVLREHFRRTLGVSPQDYRKQFAGTLAG